MADKEAGVVQVQEANDDDDINAPEVHDIDIAVAEAPSWAGTVKIFRTPYTWLPPLMCEFHRPDTNSFGLPSCLDQLHFSY